MYKGNIMRKKLLLCLLCTNIVTYNAQLYIKNWSINPVIITKLHVIEGDTAKNIDTSIFIEPGHSTLIDYGIDDKIYSNFSAVAITFSSTGYSKLEEIFLPKQPHETVSLSFTDIGYTRFPFNISNKS